MLDMKQFNYYFILFTVILLSACNITKHVPDGQYLLNKSRIHTDVKNIPRSDLEDYLRQTPNTKYLEFFLCNWEFIISPVRTRRKGGIGIGCESEMHRLFTTNILPKCQPNSFRKYL